MLEFKREVFHSRIVLPDGETTERPIEIRTHPITSRTCRITYSRGEEREPGADSLPKPPPFAADLATCPFCPPSFATHTPRFPTDSVYAARGGWSGEAPSSSPTCSRTAAIPLSASSTTTISWRSARPACSPTRIVF
jgi:hypothetical protein